jgi:hypothetical protein
MKRTFLFLLLLCFIGCQKKITSTSQPNPLIIQAQNFFSGILTQKSLPNSDNFRANQVRDAQWDQAEVLSLSIGPAVVVPINFENRLFVKTALASSNLLDLSLLTKLMLFRDTTGKFSYQILTLIPDSNNIANNNTFSGIVLSEDWSGNSLTSPVRIGQPLMASGTSSRPVMDDAGITVCTEIDGYNYSADDPEDGYAWS